MGNVDIGTTRDISHNFLMLSLGVLSSRLQCKIRVEFLFLAVYLKPDKQQIVLVLNDIV